MRVANGLRNDAVPEAGAPMRVANELRNDAVPEAGAPMRVANEFHNDAVPEAGAPMRVANEFHNDAVPEAGAPMSESVEAAQVVGVVKSIFQGVDDVSGPIGPGGKGRVDHLGFAEGKIDVGMGRIE